MDIGGARRVWLDLVAQVADVDPQDMQIIVAFPPDLVQELAVGEHLPGMDDQARSRSYSVGVSCDLATVHRHQAVRQVDHQPPSWNTGSDAAEVWRRRATRMRASSSPIPNGFVR